MIIVKKVSIKKFFQQDQVLLWRVQMVSIPLQNVLIAQPSWNLVEGRVCLGLSQIPLSILETIK